MVIGTMAARAVLGGLVLALAGCAGNGSSGNGDPGAMAMPAGQSCQSVRAELNRLDAKGVRSKFEAGRSKGDADVDRYNQLLNLYLGARCHV
jgi:hypothetical protein